MNDNTIKPIWACWDAVGYLCRDECDEGLDARRNLDRPVEAAGEVAESEGAAAASRFEAWRDGEHAMNTGGGNERCPICLVTFHPLSTYVGYDWTTEGATAKVPLSKLLSLSHALSLREVCRKRRVNYQKYAVIRNSKKY